MDNLFDGFEVVSRYTDKQAVDDGVLVAVSAKDRVTRNAWSYLGGQLERTDDDSSGDAIAGDLALRYFREFGLEAIRVYEHNIGGGIFSFDVLGRKMWIIPNELGGLTLMFPEDY